MLPFTKFFSSQEVIMTLWSIKCWSLWRLIAVADEEKKNPRTQEKILLNIRA